VDEHLPHLGPLYAEAHRLAAPGASYALAGIHPQFLMVAGIPTHFDRAAARAAPSTPTCTC
jgi:hypothetical protein